MVKKLKFFTIRLCRFSNQFKTITNTYILLCSKYKQTNLEKTNEEKLETQTNHDNQTKHNKKTSNTKQTITNKQMITYKQAITDKQTITNKKII